MQIFEYWIFLFSIAYNARGSLKEGGGRGDTAPHVMPGVPSPKAGVGGGGGTANPRKIFINGKDFYVFTHKTSENPIYFYFNLPLLLLIISQINYIHILVE